MPKFEFEHIAPYDITDSECQDTDALYDPREVTIADPYGRTHSLIQTRADEVAADQGMLFDIARVRHLHAVFSRRLRLWEGEWAGKTARFLPWHYETLVSIFGWVRWSEQWQYYVRRFSRSQIWIGKKNAKSPTGANVGIYLWRYDGVQGNHVYSCAKDGSQAGTMHAHAVEVSHASFQTELRNGTISHNKSTGKLTYNPTRSDYQIMSGDNVRSQEGKNGSLILDEVHVVEQRLATVIEDMDASRPDALQFKISTAGKGLETYGRREYQRGCMLRDEELGSTHEFVKIYEAPQNATDHELVTNRKHWYSANPCLGQVVDEVKFEQALEAAYKGSVFQWVGFKQRRLNIWAASENPWLDPVAWDKCEDIETTFSFAKMAKRPCGLAGDFSRIRDTTSVVFTFIVEDALGGLAWFQHPVIWIPEGRVDELDELVPYRDWARRGYVRIVPGDDQDEETLKRDIAGLCRQVDVRLFYYDKTFASSIAKHLENNRLVREAVTFGQGHADYAKPTQEYEKAVRRGTLYYEKNLCFSWQAKQAMLHEDREGRGKPVKPSANETGGKDTYKVVDAVQAAVMSWAAANEMPQTKRILGKLGAIVMSEDGSAEFL